MQKNRLSPGLSCAFLTLFLMWGGISTAATINDVRVWPSPQKARVVFDLDGTAAYKIFSLSDPHRVVIDFSGSRALRPIRISRGDNAFISDVRSSERGKQDYRVVIDAKQALRVHDFLLTPNQQYGHRLVVDLFSVKAVPVIDAAVKHRPELPSSPTAKMPLRDVVIIVDAGHGGEDPGALGHRRSKEKDLVLLVAKKLKKSIDQVPGMRAVLTRSKDYYLSLRERTRLARAKNGYADLFISIHADAFNNKSARGSSVFILSNRGASSEAARWLAASENSADLMGGVSLSDKDDMLATVLLDLSQTGTIEASFNVAQSILKEMGKVGRLHKDTVQRAGFVVLKSPDIPSVLIETAFISNPGEERKLRSSSYQWKLANAITAGVSRYFYNYPPPRTQVALYTVQKERKYMIRKGDTLSEIANQHRISIDSIKRINGLKNNRLKVGQVLQLPAL